MVAKHNAAATLEIIKVNWFNFLYKTSNAEWYVSRPVSVYVSTVSLKNGKL